MLKVIPLLFLIQPASAAPLVIDSSCSKYELWKGGDDGMTNRIFDEIVMFNKGRQSCSGTLRCEKLYLLIPTHATPVEGEHKARFDVEIYRDLGDRTKPLQKFTVECDLSRRNCAEKVFAGLR